jgi:hypothetical protein
MTTSWYGRRALRRRRDLPREALSLAAATALLVSVALVILVPGCGPIEYINQVSVKAASAVSAAKLAQADRLAPYEYTAAEEYLHKAREEAAYAEYQEAIEYGRRSEEMANKGRAIAVARLSQGGGASSAATPSREREEPRPAPRPEAE